MSGGPGVSLENNNDKRVHTPLRGRVYVEDSMNNELFMGNANQDD